MSDLPEGFVVEGQSRGGADLPPGFVVQQATPYRGTILPFSKDASGHVGFDSNAGLVGMAKRAVEGLVSGALLPGDVATGKTPVLGPDGHTNPEVIGRSLELGSLVTPINPGVRAGDRAIPGVANNLVREKPSVPTAQELAAAGAADIKAARQSDLAIDPSALSGWSAKVQRDLLDSGVHPVDAPNTFTKLKELESAPAGSYITPSNLQSLRESLGATAQNFNPQAAKDQLAASRAIKGLDGFLPSLDPSNFVARPASAAPATKTQIVAQALDAKREADRVASLFERGRGNYAAAMRSNDITGTLDRANTGILERAESRAQAANSGRNLDNTIRQKVASVLEKPKEVSGLSDDEIAAMNGVIEGSAGRNIARYIGNVAGGGGGFGQIFGGAVGGGAGMAAAGPAGAVIGASVPVVAGAAAKTIANAMARRALSKTDELLRTRSPLYQERLAQMPMEAEGLAKRAALARLLLLSQDSRQ